MKYKCDVVQDLMPLCVDNAASEDSKNVVVEHIAECKKCEQFYQQVIKEIPLDSRVSEENRGYVEIAKRLKKRKILLRSLTAVTVFILMELLLNYANGYRFTSESAAQTSKRLNYSSQLIGNYDWGDWEFFIFDSENSYEVVTATKHWNGWRAEDNSLVWPKYYVDKGAIINAGNLYYWTDTDQKYGIQLFPMIVEDSKVASIEISVFDKSKKIDVTTNKLLILTFENGDTTKSNNPTGYAYDRNGKVLYQLEESEESMRLVWNKVN
jgi:hypothetical protein